MPSDTTPAARAAKPSHLCHALIVLALCCSSITPAVSQAQGVAEPDAVTPDGGRYYGPLAHGLRQGEGTVEWDGGVRYEGGFLKGLFEGKGKLVGHGEEYAGEFKAGQYAGQGRLKSQDGRKYQGEFVAGRMHGHGEYTTPDGQIYDGSFETGEFTGTGTYKRLDGSQHQGQFLKWRPQGPGTYKDAEGNVYAGNFVDGSLDGPGSMVEKNGSRYEGAFKKWVFEGPGVLRLANGDEYRGAFAHGLFDGEGTLTFATAQKDGATKKTGVWRYGVLQDKEAAQRMLANVETALYNQRALLNAALAAVAPPDPNKINLYLLAVAGDGSQEVFHRETTFVKTQFDRDFNTAGHSMVLANSRNTVSLLPMATVTSIRESIQGIAGRMDKEKDVLFLYLTSHGSADHQLSLDQDGLNLRNLSAQDLGAALKESGIRWKVVVVSACYSGGFIEPLKDDHTLVITASRPDRRSFGCADENDFTYFGRAFFKESLPTSRSFTAAFARAKALVQKWEDDDFKDVSKTAENEHSEPQISTAPLIEKHLQRWRDQMQ